MINSATALLNSFTKSQPDADVDFQNLLTCVGQADV